ncbi:MAG: N-acetyltransferase [Hyphomicrobiaceae bacterium]|nr:N-acetyltransferase [Hyphomicrobiaceae bacterium]
MASDIVIRHVLPEDLPQVSALHARVFGPGRFTRTAYRIREGTPPVSPFCRKALLDGRLAAAIRFTPVAIGGESGALLLGPLAVEPQWAGKGYGRRLIAEGMAQAKADGVRLVVLVGDEPYYGRFGFSQVAPGRIRLPGPVDPARVLAAELAPDALFQLSGLVTAG